VTDAPSSACASFNLLTAGYVGDRIASTVSLARDGELCLVIDPGMVADRRLILDPLATLGVDPGDVTDVVFSHHHPDHTINAALFPRARYHDHWAIYDGDVWTSRPAEGFELSPSVRLIHTPGHTPQDITTLIGTPDGILAATHLWWHVGGPAEDPYATDPVALHEGRQRVAALAGIIVPGHGKPFSLDAAVPR